MKFPSDIKFYIIPVTFFVAAVTIAILLIKSRFISLTTRKSENNNNMYSNRKLKYVALGDSIATGTGANEGYTKKYEQYLKEKTGKKIEYINLGKDGWTTTHFLHALRHDANFRKQIKDADFITWDIGGNDFLYSLAKVKANINESSTEDECYKKTLENFKNNWNKIIKEIKLLSHPDAILRTTDNYLAFKNWGKHVKVLRPYAIDANKFIHSCAKANNVLVGNVVKKFNGNNLSSTAEGLLFIDTIHPNQLGHNAIAESLIELGLYK